MVKNKNRGGAVAAGPKQPKPAAAKPGVVKPTVKCTKPACSFPSVGKENRDVTKNNEKGKKRERLPEGAAAAERNSCDEQQQKGGKRKRHQPARFGEFEQPSPSLGSPDSQVQIREEPAGAAEAREAEALNLAASAMFGAYLECDDGPSIKQKMAPVIEKLHADRDAYNKSKAEAKQKAEQAAAAYVPVDQRKLPSPIKLNPELERIRKNKKDRKGCVGSVALEGPAASPPPIPVASDQLQTLRDEVCDLKARMVLKEGEVERLKQKEVVLEKENQQLKIKLLEQDSEIQRLRAAHTNENKASKVSKESIRLCSEIKEIRKEMEQVASQLGKYTSTMDTLRSRLDKVESQQSS